MALSLLQWRVVGITYKQGAPLFSSSSIWPLLPSLAQHTTFVLPLSFPRTSDVLPHSLPKEVLMSSSYPSAHWPTLAFLESLLLPRRLKAAILSPWVICWNLLWDGSGSFNVMFCKQCGCNQYLPMSTAPLCEAVWFTYAQNKHSCWNEQATGAHYGPFSLLVNSFDVSGWWKSNCVFCN